MAIIPCINLPVSPNTCLDVQTLMGEQIGTLLPASPPLVLMSCWSSTLICVSKHGGFAVGHDRHNEAQWANRHLGVGERARELLTTSGYMLVIRERVRNEAGVFHYLRLCVSAFPHAQPHPWLRHAFLCKQPCELFTEARASTVSVPSLDNQCQVK